MCAPPPTCTLATSECCTTVDAPPSLRPVIAANVRALALARFGEVRPMRLAAEIGWHVPAVYAVLGCRVNLCVDRIGELASGLSAMPADLLRGRARTPGRGREG